MDILSFLKKLSTPTPKTWRETFNAQYVQHGKNMYSGIKKRHKNIGYDNAYNLALSYAKNLRISDKLPDALLQHIIKYYVMNSCCRSETLPEDLTQQIRHYIQTKTKREFALVLVMLKNTSYTAWECLEQQSIGIDWYEWQSKGCPIHEHMGKFICNWNTPVPLSITKDPSVKGPIHAGQGYHCLCFSAGVTGIDDLTGHLKIFDGSKIKRISKNDFTILYEKSQKEHELI